MIFTEQEEKKDSLNNRNKYIKVSYRKFTKVYSGTLANSFDSYFRRHFLKYLKLAVCGRLPALEPYQLMKPARS